jgi:succinate dehydrogenase / fumarate reductase iron-sulfur subunit
MRLILHVWRQESANAAGKFERYEVDDVTPDMSFLETLDVLNERLIGDGTPPIAFDHDCREGICGTCGLVINGEPHGPQQAATTCQLHMRKFEDGAEIWVEPWRARAFPVVRDLVVDRTAFDRIVEAGGYISVRTGAAPDANEIPIGKDLADRSMDAAACIGCGACPTPRRCCSPPPRCATSTCCRRANRSAICAFAGWWRRWMRKVSAAAPTTSSARPHAPSRSASSSSPR